MHLPTGSLGVYTLLGLCSKRDKGLEMGKKLKMIAIKMLWKACEHFHMYTESPVFKYSCTLCISFLEYTSTHTTLICIDNTSEYFKSCIIYYKLFSNNNILQQKYIVTPKGAQVMNVNHHRIMDVLHYVFLYDM